MKNISLNILFVVFGLFCAPAAMAQSWQWGRTNVQLHGIQFDASMSVLDDSGHIIVTGSSSGGLGSVDHFIAGKDTVNIYNSDQEQITLKIDTNGNFIWAKGSKGAHFVSPKSIIADHIGNVYVLGSYDDTACYFDTCKLSNPLMYSMYYLVKYSPAGTVLWAQNIAPMGATTGAIGVDGSNNLYVTGSFSLRTINIGGIALTNANPSGDSTDVLVAKYDPLGNVTWAKRFGDRLSDDPFAMLVTANGTIYISGSFVSRKMLLGGTWLYNPYFFSGGLASQLFFTKMDNNGNVIWAENMDYKIELVEGLATDAAENIYVVGGVDTAAKISHDTITMSNTNVLIGKYDSSGATLWTSNAGGTGADFGFSISLDNCNNVWVAATTANYTTVNFDSHTAVPVPYGPDPGFIVEYNDTGVYKSSIMLTSGGDDYLGVLADRSAHFYIVGDYMHGPMTFGADTLAYAAGEELLVARYGPTDCTPEHTGTLYDQKAAILSFDVSVFPNPASGECNIHGNADFPPGSCAALFDLSGRLVQSCMLSGRDNIISVSGLAPGLYQCRVVTGNGMIINRKVVVMTCK